MLYMKRYLLLIIGTSILSIFYTKSTHGQDAHFSQFYATPLAINPALAGVHTGSYRIGTVYREQWRSALESPFKTTNFSGDLKLDLGLGSKSNEDYIGVGFSFFGDRVNGFDFNTTAINLTIAYHKTINAKKKSFLGLGAQLGVMQRSISYEDLFFQDQFNSLDGYTLNTSEVLPENNYAVPDFSVGLNYSSSPSKSLSYNIGVAMYHFNQPNVSFYKNSTIPDPALEKENNLYSRMVLNTSMSLKLSELFAISPRLLILSQGDHTELSLGNDFRIEFYERDYMAIHFGAWLRMVDNTSGISPESFIPMIGLDYKNFLFGVSYDIGLQDAFDSRLGLSSFEFSVTYRGNYDNDSGYCPTF